MLVEIREGIYLTTPDEPFFQGMVRTDLSLAESVRLSLPRGDYHGLFVQTVLGHANEGHRHFYNRAKFPEVTLPDIIIAAGLDLDTIKQQRQDKIDEVREWIELAKQRKVDRLLVKGRPLLGVEMLKDEVIDPEYVFRGMILAGLMDNYEWRQNAVAHYNAKTIDNDDLVIGGGTSIVLDKQKLIEWKPFAIDELAKGEATAEIWAELNNLGIITDTSNPHAEVVYVRKKKGLGTSDDTAFILAGELYKSAGKVAARSAFWGAFIVDGVDTYDKCVMTPLEGGYDELIGRELKKDFPGLVPKETVYQLIYYSAKGNSGYVVSSSHKRLIEFQEMARPRLPTLQQHLRFMEEGKGPDGSFKVGFERQPGSNFYSRVRRRVEHLQKELKV
ncbi:hypothetical protein J4210_04705 [Candidatus Woesearchaeota archaeon]|nr:hypothetical protein [Candidatus Woesearchaeota archaeon]